MSMIVQGGLNVYGYDIGILMLDATFPRIPGDIGNAKTWDFPVLYKKVDGGTPQKVMVNSSNKVQKIDDFIENVQSEYTKTIGHDAGFFACSSGDGVKEIF